MDMMRDKTLKQLITLAYNIKEAENYFQFRLDNPQILISSAKEILANLPHSFGACAMLSAVWAAILRDRYSIPAIAVAGDLKIENITVFQCKNNIPEKSKYGKEKPETWDGHCWIEVNDYVGDLSIFRTAYAISGPSILKEFILSNFGNGKGCLICSHQELNQMGMEYLPKFVLNESQVTGLIKGLGTQINKDT